MKFTIAKWIGASLIILMSLQISISQGDIRPIPKVASAPVTVLSNLPGNDLISNSIGGPVRRAVIVGVPAGNNYELTNFRLRLTGVSNCTMGVYLDGGATPGAFLASLGSQNIASGVNTYTYVPASTVTLVAGQNYWFIVDCTSTTGWRANNPPILPTGIFTFVGMMGFNGASWNASSFYSSLSIDADEVLPPCTITTTKPTLINPIHKAHTTDHTPTFTWTNVSGEQSYRLMVYLEDRSFEFKKRVFVPNYTLTASEALTPAKYLWRVRTQDATCGTWTGWSPRNTLFVD